MSLPNDLIDYILSFLQSDLDTLQKCAQSHSTLHKLSERYFYADIVLRDHFGREGILTIEFMQLLAKRPDIAKHVRCLTVRMSYGTSPTGYHIKGVASLLPTFSGLTNFIIKGSYLYDCPFKSKITWPHLHGMFQEAFLDFLHTQGKKKVTVCDAVGFPLSLLNNCENVRMTLHRCKDTQYDNESTEDVSLSCRKPFEHLSLVCCSETCLKSTTAWLQTRSLRSLEYQGWPQSNDKEIRQSLPRVLVACSHSLTNLCLHIEDHFQTSYGISDNSAIYDQNDVRKFPFTLAGLCYLEQLTLKANARLSCNTTGASLSRSCIPAIVELISTAPPSFKQISLELQYSFSDIPNPEDIWLPFVPLAATCSSLSIMVRISTRLKSQKYPPEKFCSTADYGGLKPYVEKGIVIMIPEIPTN